MTRIKTTELDKVKCPGHWRKIRSTVSSLRIHWLNCDRLVQDFVPIHQVDVGIFQYKLWPACDARGKVRINNVGRIFPDGNSTNYSKFHGSASNSCQDLSLSVISGPIDWSTLVAWLKTTNSTIFSFVTIDFTKMKGVVCVCVWDCLHSYIHLMFNNVINNLEYEVQMLLVPSIWLEMCVSVCMCVFVYSRYVHHSERKRVIMTAKGGRGGVMGWIQKEKESKTRIKAAFILILFF